ncbi:MAG: DsbA family oxidoreductase [Burkholderiaceae bacterium]
MKIDFVSDISCPWCAIGLASLETALERLGPEVPVTLHFQPFELNPQMAPEGEDTNEHIARKYGMPEEQVQKNREAIRERGAAVGFTFNMAKRGRIYNTFDAHRLLHWAEVLDEEQGKEPGKTGENALALKHAFLQAYFTDGQDPSAHDVLVRYATEAGLDGETARDVLASGRYTAEVRERERYYQQRGISSVPSIIIDDKHLIQGGQPPEMFEQALRQIAANPAA